jgi:hypothetical protein
MLCSNEDARVRTGTRSRPSWRERGRCAPPVQLVRYCRLLRWCCSRLGSRAGASDAVEHVKSTTHRPSNPLAQYCGLPGGQLQSCELEKGAGAESGMAGLGVRGVAAARCELGSRVAIGCGLKRGGASTDGGAVAEDG